MTLAEIRRNPFAWPGGYPVYAVLDDGFMLCRRCVHEPEVHEGGEADGWRYEGSQVLWEAAEDGPETCAHCGVVLDVAYPSED